MTGSARKLLHTAGRSGWPNIAQRLSSVSCAQRIPAGLPLGMPGIGELIDGAMQQAPQPARQASAVTAMSSLADSIILGRAAVLCGFTVQMAEPAQQRLHGHALHHDRKGDHGEGHRNDLIAVRQCSG